METLLFQIQQQIEKSIWTSIEFCLLIMKSFYFHGGAAQGKWFRSAGELLYHLPAVVFVLLASCIANK